jgi:hypothetical protein
MKDGGNDGEVNQKQKFNYMALSTVEGVKQKTSFHIYCE